MVAAHRPHSLPLPKPVGITPAAVPDLAALRPILDQVYDTTIVADKAYADQALKEQRQQRQNSTLLTPVKQVKGKCQALKQFDQAHDRLFSKAVSSLKQPVESFFNWLQEKTNIQFASKVRSAAGLRVHTFGRLAAALIAQFILNS